MNMKDQIELMPTGTMSDDDVLFLLLLGTPNDYPIGLGEMWYWACERYWQNGPYYRATMNSAQ